MVHVLIHGSSSAFFDGISTPPTPPPGSVAPQLISVQYDSATNTYVPWATRPAPTMLPSTLSNVETATIALDSTGRMWLSSGDGSNVLEYWADAPYSSFSAPVTIASGVEVGDQSAVVTLPNAIGVLFSNQNSTKYSFRTHADGTDPRVLDGGGIPPRLARTQHRPRAG